MMSKVSFDDRGLPVRFPVLSVGITAVTLPEAVEIIDGWIERNQRFYVNCCASDVVVQACDDSRLADVINSSGMAVPDGMPLVWLGKAQRRHVGRVYGPDLMLALCAHGISKQYRHFLYGSTEEVLDKLDQNLRRRFPGIVIAGRFSPPFRTLDAGEKGMVIDMINKAQPHIVWVGLGTPKQDYWVGEFRERLDASVLIAVGAAFDFHAGTLKQAPRWVMRCGMEWFFRLLQEPVRLCRRYLVRIPRFLFLLATQAMFGWPKPPVLAKESGGEPPRRK